MGPSERGSSIGVISLSFLIAFATGGVTLRGDDWPEWRRKGRLGVWNATGIFAKFPQSGLTATWRTPVNAGYAGPAVAGGRVFVTDSRRVKANQAIERALALDERTGQVLWTREWQTNYSGLQLVYAIGPRATPTVDGDRVYVPGAMGNLLALDVSTGRVLWEKDYRVNTTATPSRPRGTRLRFARKGRHSLTGATTGAAPTQSSPRRGLR